MGRNTSKYLLFSAVLLLTLLCACQEDITEPSDFINIQLKDRSGFNFAPGNNYNTNISIGDYPLYLPSSSGSCRIPNVKPPYDVTLEFDGYSVFKNVSKRDVVLSLPQNYFDIGPVNSSRSRISVTTPFNYGIVIAKFISTEKFFQDEYAVVNAHERANFPTWIYFEPNVNTIHGKILVMGCEYFYGYETNYYFEYYYLKDTVLQNGQGIYLNLSANDFTQLGSPGYLIYDITFPQWARSYETTCSICFDGQNKGSEIMFYFGGRYNSGYIYLPPPMPIQCSYRIDSYYEIDNHYLRRNPFVTRQYSPVPGINSIEMVHKSVNITSPQAGYVGVNENTVFSFDDNLSRGIYSVNLYEVSNGVYFFISSIYTDEKSLKFSDLRNRGFQPEPNSHYYWTVTKLLGFNNIDDFLSSDIYERPEFNEIAGSEGRHFFTAP